MKLICVSNFINGEFVEGLVVGKIYEAIEDPRYTYEEVYHLKNDDPNELLFYNVELFKRLDDMRDNKLKDLGI